MAYLEIYDVPLSASRRPASSVLTFQSSVLRGIRRPPKCNYSTAEKCAVHKNPVTASSKWTKSSLANHLSSSPRFLYIAESYKNVYHLTRKNYEQIII